MASPRPAGTRATSPGLRSQPKRSGASGSARLLIQHAQEPVQLATGRLVLGLEVDGRTELAHGGGDVVLHDVDLTQVDVRIVSRLVAYGLLGALAPRDRFFDPSELDQIRADIVIGVAEVGIDGDGAPALRDGLVQTILHAVRPAEEGMGLGRRRDADRLLVE